MFKSLILSVLLAIPALAQAGDTLADVRPALQDNPDGRGQPNAVTCRKPQQIPGRRVMAPPVCLINDDWAKLRREGQDVSPDGRQVVTSEKARSLNPQPCSSMTSMGGGNPKGASMGMGLSISPTCF